MEEKMKNDLHKDLAAIKEMQEKKRAFRKTHGILAIDVDYIQIDYEFMKRFAPLKDWKLSLDWNPFDQDEYTINIDGVTIITLVDKEKIAELMENQND